MHHFYQRRCNPEPDISADLCNSGLTIVFAALAVSRLVQQRSGLAIGKVVKTLRPLRSATIAINGTRHTFPPHLSPEIRDLIEAISGPDLTH